MEKVLLEPCWCGKGPLQCARSVWMEVSLRSSVDQSPARRCLCEVGRLKRVSPWPDRPLPSLVGMSFLSGSSQVGDGAHGDLREGNKGGGRSQPEEACAKENWERGEILSRVYVDTERGNPCCLFWKHLFLSWTWKWNSLAHKNSRHCVT